VDAKPADPNRRVANAESLASPAKLERNKGVTLLLLVVVALALLLLLLLLLQRRLRLLLGLAVLSFPLLRCPQLASISKLLLSDPPTAFHSNDLVLLVYQRSLNLPLFQAVCRVVCSDKPVQTHLGITKKRQGPLLVSDFDFGCYKHREG
jgi:hypothetical protein